MNHKRGIVALIAALVFIFFFGFVWHGLLMKRYYNEMPEHWRSSPVFSWLILGHVILAFAFTGLYVSKIGRHGAGIGFGYGVLMGIFAAGADTLRYATEPLGMIVICLWVVGVIIQFSLTGAIVGAIYRPLNQ